MTKLYETNGIHISCEERGSGEPLLLIMGLGAPGAKWEPHAQAYEKHFRVLIPDNRGAGLSDKPEAGSYTVAEMAADMIGLLDAMGIDSAHINGISMGGAVAQHMAIHYPERVRSVILTNTFSHCCVSFRRAIELLRDTCGVLDGATATRLCQWIIFAQPFQEANEAYMLQCEQEDLSYPHPMPAYAYKAQCNAILGFDVREDLEKIQAPVLIVGGDRDLMIPVTVSEYMHDHIPGAELFLAKDGGHVQHWEQLEQYNRVTTEFLLKHAKA